MKWFWCVLGSYLLLLVWLVVVRLLICCGYWFCRFRLYWWCVLNGVFDCICCVRVCCYWILVLLVRNWCWCCVWDDVGVLGLLLVLVGRLVAVVGWCGCCCLFWCCWCSSWWVLILVVVCFCWGLGRVIVLLLVSWIGGFCSCVRVYRLDSGFDCVGFGLGFWFGYGLVFVVLGNSVLVGCWLLVVWFCLCWLLF